MDVEEYLRQVREEEAALPGVCVAESTSTAISSDGKTAKQFERLRKIDDESLCLDPGYRLSENEMSYFRTMKSVVNATIVQASSQDKCSLLKHCMPVLLPGKDTSYKASSLHNIDDTYWPRLFDSEPPDILKLCALGISFATVHELLHRLASLVCESKGKHINEKSSRWLFVILLVLDELHAMIESVSYELQRIKRATSRRLQVIKESATTEEPGTPEINETCEETQREIASCTLNICIIQQYFNQR